LQDKQETAAITDPKIQAPQKSDASETVSICHLPKIYTDAEIDERLTKWQRRHMRLSNLFHEVAIAVADDAKAHPWKLIFYAIPIPPGAATLMFCATLLQFAIGRSERIKNYRKDIRHSLMGPIHYERYKLFLEEKKLHKKGEQPGLKVKWAKFANERYFQVRRYFHVDSINWINNNPQDSWLKRNFTKSLIWDIERMKKGSHGYLFEDLPQIKSPKAKI
jgi:hypothetical protein